MKSKEVKLGLGVIGVLTVVMAAVLVYRLRGDDAPVAPPTDSSQRPAAGAAAPTIVASQTGSPPSTTGSSGSKLAFTTEPQWARNVSSAGTAAGASAAGSPMASGGGTPSQSGTSSGDRYAERYSGSSSESGGVAVDPYGSRYTSSPAATAADPFGRSPSSATVGTLEDPYAARFAAGSAETTAGGTALASDSAASSAAPGGVGSAPAATGSRYGDRFPAPGGGTPPAAGSGNRTADNPLRSASPANFAATTTAAPPPAAASPATAASRYTADPYSRSTGTPAADTLGHSAAAAQPGAAPAGTRYAASSQYDILGRSESPTLAASPTTSSPSTTAGGAYDPPQRSVMTTSPHGLAHTYGATLPASARGSASGGPWTSTGTTAGNQDDQQYVVGPNDNFWTVAERVYGNGGYFKALHEYNRDRCPRPDGLRVNDVLLIPTVEQLHRDFPDLCPKPRAASPAYGTAVAVSGRSRAGGRVYTVRQGDTLFDIARAELGKAARWAEIYELNQDLLGEDFDFLAPGMQLILPDGAGASPARVDPLTRQPGQSYQR